MLTIFLYISSAEAEGSGDVRHVQIPRKEPWVGVAEDQQLQLPEPVHGRSGVHRVYQQLRKVSIDCVPTAPQSQYIVCTNSSAKWVDCVCQQLCKVSRLCVPTAL